MKFTCILLCNCFVQNYHHQTMKLIGGEDKTLPMVRDGRFKMNVFLLNFTNQFTKKK